MITVIIMSRLTDAVAAERFKTALKLHAAGIDLQRQKLRRMFPTEDAAQIEERLNRWLLREGEPGDSPGRQVDFPREHK